MTEATKTINELRQVKDQAVNTLETDIARLRNDIAALTESLKAIAADAAGSAVQNVKGRIGAASEQARAAADATKEKVQGTVEAHPFYTILAAVGVGFLLGQWARRD